MILDFDLLLRVAPGTAAGGAAADIPGSAGLVINSGGPRVINITVALDAAVTFNVRINGTNIPFNNGTALTAGALYTFAWIANGQDTFSFRSGGAANILYFCATISNS